MKWIVWTRKISGCCINSQWKLPNYQSTSVFPTTSDTWRDVEAFARIAAPQRRAAKHLGHTWYIGNFFFFQIQMRHLQHLILQSPIQKPLHWYQKTHRSKWWPWGWVAKACHLQAAADSRGFRTCVCANTFGDEVAHAGGEGWINILPWYGVVGVAIPPVSREGGRTGLPQKGKWSPRGTGTIVLTYPRSAPRGTGKAGENGQLSGEMGGSSPGTHSRR